MAIQMSENFSLLNSSPLDGRLLYNSIEEMKSMEDYMLYSGIIATVKGSNKTYQWFPDNTATVELGKWREYNGGGSSTDEKVKLTSTSTNAKYLSDFIDNSTIEMDADNERLIVKKIEGQTVSIAEINFLGGVTSNIQEQINNLSKSMSMYGVFDTKADLLTATSTTAPNDGATAIIRQDESSENAQMTYIYIESASAWTPVAESSVDVRDFTINPINLDTETTGILAKEKIDEAIARLADVLDKATYAGSADGVVKSADTLANLTHTIAELNDCIDNSHKHLNKDTLDKIVSDGIGEKVLADNGEYIDILSIGTDKPTYNSQIWIDTSSGSATMRIFDGNSWIEISSAKDGKDGTTYTPKVGTVTDGDELAVTIDIDTTTSEAIYNFVIPAGKDGKDGTNGKSVDSVEVNETNNLMVTYSDGETKDAGKIKVNISANFLTAEGFGNLRYYQGVLQYYDATSDTWLDTNVAPDNIYIMNMIPQPMKSITCMYNVEEGHYKLNFEEPDDTVIDGQIACMVEKVIIRRKLGSEPLNEVDGTYVGEVLRRDFGSYKKLQYTDDTFTPNIGETWYYKAFPVSTNGFYNISNQNCTNVICKDYYLYGFTIDQNESNPASMITYIEDNQYYSPAYMDYDNDTFNYGDWENVWFIKNLKPCMLKYDGTVAYQLDKNDYTKKVDGSDSDITDVDFEGNAMVGIPKVYWKIVDNGDNTANVYVCSKKIDDDFHCWSHIDNNGNEIDYCYMPIYNGYNDGTRLRSLSGKTPMVRKTAQQEITLATANNTGNDIIWYTEVYSDRQLINILLLLIGKSTNTQTVFGTGNNNSYSSDSKTGVKKTGTLDTKGLFWGNKDNKTCVKIFGMENWWGNTYHRIGGWVSDNGVQKIKLTYGQLDGSTVDGYNTDGSGYISIGATPSSKTGGYISKMNFINYGLLPAVLSGSSTTYYTDGMWYNNSIVSYIIVGGSSGSELYTGAFYTSTNNTTSYTNYTLNASPSCKPLATT